MSGQEAYEKKPRERSWNDLTDEEREAWNRGAAAPPVTGTFHALGPANTLDA